eukprot:TRINITY_DN56507_c0_g1_i1.p1 TRINITY_DN56507_c0_g1~~TRINITY_DN56507_c0_g1_i1.p1  ORF type:complete len:240 (+),score=51.71 TRINITY_DN56507_c0_g1_i1:150-869(+)
MQLPRAHLRGGQNRSGGESQFVGVVCPMEPFRPLQEKEGMLLRKSDSLEAQQRQWQKRQRALHDSLARRRIGQTVEAERFARRLADDQSQFETTAVRKDWSRLQDAIDLDRSLERSVTSFGESVSKLYQTSYSDFVASRENVLHIREATEQRYNEIRRDAAKRGRELREASQTVTADIVRECRQRAGKTSSVPHTPRHRFIRLDSPMGAIAGLPAASAAWANAAKKRGRSKEKSLGKTL